VTRYRRHPAVVATELSGDIVALHLDSKRYYTLNATASCIWRALSEDADIPALVAAVTSTFEVTESEASGHVAQLVEEMLVMRLVERCAD
jgi:hypothetical protein